MTLLLVAGILVILAGLLTIVFGIPVKEFGFGNTLILTGTIGACTGLIMISMGLALRELKKWGPRSGEAATAPPISRREFQLPPDEDDDAGLLPPVPSPQRQEPAARTGSADPATLPWQDESPRARAAAAEPAEPKRHNLLFSSSRRERAEAAAKEGASAATPAAPQRSFEDAWPERERPRSDAIRRTARAPALSDSLPDSALIPDRYVPAARENDPARVTVLKSGVVDGMAYSLYSDGSIEAQMPEGMMSFDSIEDLREHLDNRG
jgi:hypothetical protein